MPFINSKVNVKTTAEQQRELKERLGKAIATIPGKSESWLMVNLEDERVTLTFESVRKTILNGVPGSAVPS